MTRYHIADMPQPLDPQLLDALQGVETATIGHVRHWGFLHRRIQPLGHRHRIVGCAVTLALPAQDSTLLHHAVGLLRPGDCLLIDRLGDDIHACFGGAVATAAKMAQVAGVVIDGPATDPTEIAQSGVPVWCTGIAPITTRLYNLGGMFNHAIQCGGVCVRPGDVVIADENGVLVLPRHEAAGLGRAAQERQQRTQARIDQVLNGEKLGQLSGASAMVQAEMQAQGPHMPTCSAESASSAAREPP